MKMHVLIVGLAVLYWAVMTAAQTAFTAAEPCPAGEAVRLAAPIPAPISAMTPEPVFDAGDDSIVADRIYRLAALSEEEMPAAEPQCGR